MAESRCYLCAGSGNAKLYANGICPMHLAARRRQRTEDDEVRYWDGPSWGNDNPGLAADSQEWNRR